MFQTKEQDKPPEINPNKIEMSDLPYREFKILITKMFTEVRRATPKRSENFQQRRKILKSNEHK